MRFRITAAAVAAAAITTALSAAPALATVPPAPIQTGATATCDTGTGTWKIIWRLRNNLGAPAGTTLLASTPEGLAVLPPLPGHTTVEVPQIVDGASAGARLEYLAVWTSVNQSWKSTGTWVAPGACVAASAA